MLEATKWRGLRPGEDMAKHSSTAITWQGRGLARGVSYSGAGHARSLPITMRFAPTRASRAPEYTALMERGHVNEWDEVWRGMADDSARLLDALGGSPFQERAPPP